MSFFDRLFSKPAVKAVDLLQQISKRAEDLTLDEQAKSFVAIRRIDGALKNRDSRILFGRRGTGKTHVLSYVAKSARDSGDTVCTLDLRTLGSNNSIYADSSLSPSARATRLIRDVVVAIHDRLLDAYTEPGSKFSGAGLEKAIDEFGGCVKSVFVSETREVRERTRSGSETEFASTAGGTISAAALSGEMRGSAKRVNDVAKEMEVSTVTSPKLSVNMGDAYKTLNSVAGSAKGRIWILIDEWSSVPELLQPYLADFLRRAILPVQSITVQVAAIEYRSRFRVDHDGDRIGLELGADISADINLDDYFVYDVSPVTATEFFKNLLFRHLQAFAGDRDLNEKSPDEVISAIFSQDRVFGELVRASEGVARDFINVLQLAAMRSDETKISMSEIRSASKDWFERDKQRNIDTNDKALALLDWLRDRVIDKKKARAFLINVSASEPTIDFLFDERVLHIARRSYSAKDDPGERYRVWKVDYGCYVDLINTAKNPAGFIFEGTEMKEGGDIEVPDDDYRAVRRAVLDIAEFSKEYSS